MRTQTLTLLAGLALFSQLAAAENPFVIVNGVARDVIQAEVVRSDLARSKRPASEELIANVLIDNELMAQEAVRRGIDKKPEIKGIIELQSKDLLGKALVEDYLKQNPVPDSQLKAEYDKLKAATGNTEYQPKHILVADEKLATDIIANLNSKKPPKFEDLAKKHSKDASAQQGGDLGWLAPSNLVPEFSTAMVKLKKGQITAAPVKSQFGWHVIKLQDVRAIDYPPFDKVKGRLAGQLAQQHVRKLLAELRATAKIEKPGIK